MHPNPKTGIWCSSAPCTPYTRQQVKVALNIIRLNDNHISEQHFPWLLILRWSWNTRNIWSSTYIVDLLTSTSINQNVASQWLTTSQWLVVIAFTLLFCNTNNRRCLNIDSITQRKVRGVNYSAGDWDTFAGQAFCLLANCPRCPMWPMCPAQCWSEFVFPTRMCVHTFLIRQQCLRPKNCFNKDIKSHTY